MASSEVITKALKEIVGDKNASASEAIRQSYSRDQNYMFNEPQQPDYVVRATTKEEIRKILKVANDNKIPVVPLGCGVNIRGLCIPTRGGILLDLRGMNQIKEIDTEMMTTTIEPGEALGP